MYVELLYLHVNPSRTAKLFTSSAIESHSQWDSHSELIDHVIALCFDDESIANSLACWTVMIQFVTICLSELMRHFPVQYNIVREFVLTSLFVADWMNTSERRPIRAAPSSSI
jgi:hypothetical protein